MNEFFNENYAAWWGAGISTILLLKEIISWLKYLPNYSISYFATSEPGADDRVLIYNKSNRIANVIAIEFYTASSKKSTDRRNKDIGQYGQFRLTTIQPKQIYVMNISDPDKFNVKNGQKLYVEIFQLGKKNPFIKEVK